MFPILRHLAAMKTDFDRTMEGCDPTIRSQYSTILNTLHSTVSTALFVFFNLYMDTLLFVFIFDGLTMLFYVPGCENLR